MDDSLGSGYIALRYAQGLREQGHEVDLYGPPGYEILPGLRRGIRYRQMLGMAIKSLGSLLKKRYDVVELYGGEAWLAILLLTWIPRRRFLLVSHSNGIETHYVEIARQARAAGWFETPERWYHLDASPLMELGFQAVDALVTVSEFDRRYAAARGYTTGGRVLALENPLPDDYLGLPLCLDRGPVIGYCGSWLPRKGIALIKEDLPQVLRDFPGWGLTLVGVGNGFQAAEHFPADVLPRITVIPFVARDDLRALYQRFSIAILPSVYESFGLVAAEAMACGCALVATRVGFASGLRDGEEALLLAEPGSPHLAQAVRRLIADDGLRRAVASGGHQRVQRLRWPDAIASLESAYLSWLGDLRSGQGLE